MTRIGIYDSGIGGLTTLAKLILEFEHCDFLYYADNYNFPLGLKCEKDIERIVRESIFRLKGRCDYIVLACNTASSHTDDESVIKLLPPFENLNPQKTLVMATPSTTSRLKLSEQGYLTLDTPELASQITKMYFSKPSEKKYILDRIEESLCSRLLSLSPPENIVIGCSHYMFIESTVKKVCGSAKFFDGNEAIITKLKKVIQPTCNAGAVYFEFSGQNQFEEYVTILESLLHSYNKKKNL